MSYLWVCKGCLVGAGADPDKVTESCLGRSGKITCHFCGCVQDGSWFRHMLPRDLPTALQERLGASSFREMVQNTPMEVIESETFKKGSP